MFVKKKKEILEFCWLEKKNKKKDEKVKSKPNRIRFLQYHAMTTVTQTQQLLDLGARKSKNKQTFKGERNFFISGADS